MIRFCMRAKTCTVVAFAFLLTACGDEGAAVARQKLRQVHVPAVQKIVREDIERHLGGLERAATRLEPSFATGLEINRRERQMRVALKKLRVPPRGIAELVVSPMSFLAAVDEGGVVIARDSDEDRMKGMALGAEMAVVRDALAGRAGYGLAEFANRDRGGEPSVTILFAQPVAAEGRNVGAVVAGIPLWRMAQRLSRQLQIDNAGEAGAIFWAYLYRGDALHHFGTPPDLDQLVPDAAARAAGLRESPGGFTGEVIQFGRWYGYAVVPLPRIAPDVGMILFRSDPT